MVMMLMRMLLNNVDDADDLMLTSKTPWKERARRSMSERSAECFTEMFWKQRNVFVKKRNIITFEQMFLSKLIVKTIGNH